MIKSTQLLFILLIFYPLNSESSEVSCKNEPKPAYSDCCNRPRLLDNRDFNGCDRIKIYRNQATSVCAEYECFFIKNGLYLNSTIQIEAIQNYISRVAMTDSNRLMETSDWKNILMKSVENCVEKITVSEDVLRELYNEAPFEINPYECDVTFISIMNCIYYDVFVNCPSDAWEKSLACEAWKEFISTCMDDIETFPFINMNKLF
uniref:CSON005065 protein n=1 Tax=Culicoides sonorensis TaxID=179676 RepID=A0A336MR16_CULSO